MSALAGDVSIPAELIRMTILVFIIVWIIAGAISNHVGIGLLVAFLATQLYRQNKRIKNFTGSMDSTILGGLLERVSELEKHAGIVRPKTAEIKPEKVAPKSQAVEPTRASEPPKVASPTIPKAAEPQKLTRPAAPSGPTLFETTEKLLGKSIANFIFHGNPIARVGVVVLFIGVIFALKFAAEVGYFPIEMRLVASAVLALALLILGWKLRHRRQQYALILQGAGAGIFYITCFMAFRINHLIPGPLAFALMLAMTVLTGLLVVLQNARSLALLAIIGGFLAPALTSEGGGSHVALFSYFLILNLGIFGICWFKQWRALNVTGFFFTFIMAGAWGAKYYRPEFFSTTEPFLLIFLVLYSVINIMFSVKSEKPSPQVVDALMTFSTPFWTVLLQYPLAAQFEYGLAWSAAGFGAFHIILARVLWDRYREKLRFLIESYFAIGLGLLSLAIPFAVSSRLTSAVWSVEALALIWTGVRLRHLLSRVAGYVLLGLSSLAFLQDLQASNVQSSFFSPYFFGIFLLALTHFISGKTLNSTKEAVDQGERYLGAVLLWLSVLWWFFGAGEEVRLHIGRWHDYMYSTLPWFTWRWIPFGVFIESVFVTLSVLAFWTAARRFSLKSLFGIRFLLVPFQIVCLLTIISEVGFFNSSPSVTHPFMSFGFISWALFYLVHYRILRIHDTESGNKGNRFQHIGALLLGVIVLSWEFCWIAWNRVPEAPSWGYALLDFAPMIALLLVSRASVRKSLWPFSARPDLYLKGLRPVAWWLFYWPLLLNLAEPGDNSPIPFVPILNPLDIGQAFAVVGLIVWYIRFKAVVGKPAVGSRWIGAFCFWVFVWTTVVLLRTIHHHVGVAWDVDSLYFSNQVQTALSIYWSVLALVLMSIAHAKSWRPVWKAGAVLITIVVVKLFLVDLSSQGNFGRVIAFVGVGILMLGIGYIAPIPPKQEKA